jgi:hypothetical protein
MIEQSRLESFIEVCLGTAIGFAVSYLVGPVMYWYLDVPYSNTGNFVITSGFTVLSIIRGYAVRRWFANGLHRAAMRITSAIVKKDPA